MSYLEELADRADYYGMDALTEDEQADLENGVDDNDESSASCAEADDRAARWMTYGD